MIQFVSLLGSLAVHPDKNKWMNAPGARGIPKKTGSKAQQIGKTMKKSLKKIIPTVNSSSNSSDHLDGSVCKLSAGVFRISEEILYLHSGLSFSGAVH